MFRRGFDCTSFCYRLPTLGTIVHSLPKKASHIDEKASHALCRRIAPIIAVYGQRRPTQGGKRQGNAKQIKVKAVARRAACGYCQCLMALRLLTNRAVRAFMLPRRGLDEFVTGSAPANVAAKGKDAAKKDEKAVDANAAGRPWKADELRRMYSSRLSLSAARLQHVPRRSTPFPRRPPHTQTNRNATGS
jgi:hypothetical protein